MPYVMLRLHVTWRNTWKSFDYVLYAHFPLPFRA